MRFGQIDIGRGDVEDRFACDFGSPNSGPNTWIADLADLGLIVRVLCFIRENPL